MMTAALLELFPNPDELLETLNSLGLPKVAFSRERVKKCGITGTHVTVTVDGVEENENMHEHCHEHTHEHTHEHPHEHEHEHTHEHPHEHSHHHSSLHEIEHIVNGHLKVSDEVKRDVLCVYGLIAEAESRVHNVPVAEIHFHEVGTMDALADITAVCYLLRKLSPEQVIASPVHVGGGTVKCAHGILPVPAPATACILQGVPIYGGEIQSELCTPTGAALLKHFVKRFEAMPMMCVNVVGYGMGCKDFPRANCLRAMLGDTVDEAEGVLQLSCNVDDMTAEEIGFAMEQLFDEGALDVFTMPIGMKKCRPGTLLRVICNADDREKMLQALFRHTSTIGVRENAMRRYVLQRGISEIDTPLGRVRKKSSSGFGVKNVKYEYEDLARIARERKISLREAREMLAGLE
jgi:hypothetical protein